MMPGSTRELSLAQMWPGRPAFTCSISSSMSSSSRASDLNARLARAIERIDDAGIDQRVELGPDVAGTAGLHMFDLLFDVLEQPRFRSERPPGSRDRAHR